ncbi:19299_t:CDS:2 [Dentiscutata erythropus]|uniref:19299_t:CDS:1 n=1 Tax=Dentiscutata erythropus TaxID=1348616 RepID=A0A9N8VF18_9GLOM|nr:19299_t:CDS:2 [Dentiscutata erythropus]
MDIDDDHELLEIVVEQNYSINKERTPLPWSILFILGLILISEPINYSILLSFVKDFKITDDDKEIGKYAGFIFLYSPNFLLRVLEMAVQQSWQTFSSSAWITRKHTKFMLAEVTDKTNQKEAFSLPGLCWSFGLLGPAIGGHLSNPTIKYPVLFGNFPFLKTYPYFLPCTFAALIPFTGFIVGYFLLPETHFSNPEQKPLLHSNVELRSSNPDSLIRSILYIPSTTWICIISYVILGFYTVSFDEIYVIYSVTDIMSGGLGFSDIKLSLTLNSVGILNLIANFVIYSLATNKENLEKVYKLGRFLYIPAYLLFPLINRLAITLSPSDNGVLIFTIFALAIK